MTPLKLRNPLAFFDLETTGIDLVRDRIVEISIIKLMPDGTRITRTKRVNPGIPIPAEVTAIHGISDADVADAPTFKMIAKETAAFLEGADLAGFNILRFDLPMLVEEFLRNDVNFDASKRKLIDAQRIFHLMEPRTLSAAYSFYCGKDLVNAHSAEADTLATLEVLEAQVLRYENKPIRMPDGTVQTPVRNDIAALHEITASKMIDFAGKMVYNDKGVPIFNFGKYKGQAVQDIFDRDPAYYDWIMQNDFALNTKQKLTELKLSRLKK